MSRKRNIFQLAALTAIGVMGSQAMDVTEAQAVLYDPHITYFHGGYEINDANVGPDASDMMSGQNLYQEVFPGSAGANVIYFDTNGDGVEEPTLEINGWAALRGKYHHSAANHKVAIIADNTVFNGTLNAQSATDDLMVRWVNDTYKGITNTYNYAGKLHNAWNRAATGISDLVENGAYNIPSNMYRYNRGNYIYDYVGYTVHIPLEEFVNSSYMHDLYIMFTFDDGTIVWNQLNLEYDITTVNKYNGGIVMLDSDKATTSFKIMIDSVSPYYLGNSDGTGWNYVDPGDNIQFRVGQEFTSPRYLSEVNWNEGKVQTKIGSTIQMPIYRHTDNAAYAPWYQYDTGLKMQDATNGIWTTIRYTTNGLSTGKFKYFVGNYNFNRGFYDDDAPFGKIPLNATTTPNANPTNFSLASGKESTYDAPDVIWDSNGKEWEYRAVRQADLTGPGVNWLVDPVKTAVKGVGEINNKQYEYFYERAKTPITVRHVIVDYKYGTDPENYEIKSVIQSTNAEYKTNDQYTFSALADTGAYEFLKVVEVDNDTSSGTVDNMPNINLAGTTYNYTPTVKNTPQTVTFYYIAPDSNKNVDVVADVTSNGDVSGYLNQYLYKDASMASEDEIVNSKYAVNGALGNYTGFFGVKDVTLSLTAGGKSSSVTDPDTANYSFTEDIGSFMVGNGDKTKITSYVGSNRTGLTIADQDKMSTLYMSETNSGNSINDLGITKPILTDGLATSLSFSNTELEKLKDGTLSNELGLSATFKVPTKIRHNYKPIQWNGSGDAILYEYSGSTVEAEETKTATWSGEYSMDYNESQSLDTVNKNIYKDDNIYSTDERSGMAIAAEYEGKLNFVNTLTSSANIDFVNYFEQLRVEDKFLEESVLSTQKGQEVGTTLLYVNNVPTNFPYADATAKQFTGKSFDNSIIYDADSQYFRVEDIDDSLLASEGAVEFKDALLEADAESLAIDGVNATLYDDYAYGINLQFGNVTKIAGQTYTVAGTTRPLNVTSTKLEIVDGKTPVLEKNTGVTVASDLPVTNYINYMDSYYSLDVSDTTKVEDFVDGGSKYYVPLNSPKYKKAETTYNTLYTLNDVGLSDSTWVQENEFQFTDYLIGSASDDTVFSAQREKVTDASSSFTGDVIVTKEEATEIKETDNLYYGGLKSVSGYNLLDKFKEIFRK